MLRTNFKVLRDLRRQNCSTRWVYRLWHRSCTTASCSAAGPCHLTYVVEPCAGAAWKQVVVFRDTQHRSHCLRTNARYIVPCAAARSWPRLKEAFTLQKSFAQLLFAIIQFLPDPQSRYLSLLWPCPIVAQGAAACGAAWPLGTTTASGR